jgi:hypothetical protein
MKSLSPFTNKGNGAEPVAPGKCINVIDSLALSGIVALAFIKRKWM